MSKTDYWSRYADYYLGQWRKNNSRKYLNKLEKAFIAKAIKLQKESKSGLTYIDIGSGPGRIIDFIISSDKSYKKIAGIEKNNKMLILCKSRFAKETMVEILEGDARSIRKYLSEPADVITAIRVLKYIPEREEFYTDIASLLKPDGMLVYTLTNKHSVAYLDKLRVSHYKDTLKETRSLLSQAGLEIVHAEGYQRLPEIVHSALSRFGLSGLVYGIENLLERIFGKTRFVRTLYIAVQKTEG